MCNCNRLGTDEQVKEFEAEGRIPSIRFRVPADRDYTFKDIVKDEVRKMIEAYQTDILHCKKLEPQVYASRKLKIRIKEQLFRLLSPLL